MNAFCYYQELPSATIMNYHLIQSRIAILSLLLLEKLRKNVAVYVVAVSKEGSL